VKSKHDFPSLNSKRPDGIKPDGSAYKVVVVEPNEFQRKQIIQILESESYEVIADAKNGQEGIDIIKRLGNEIDIITTDLDMPQIDGYALLFQINDLNIKAKVVFISKETTKGVLQDLLKMGAADFILKPYQRLKILERMKLLTLKLEKLQN
jgi:two-component system chemotaxis response regulator CheY